MKWSDLRYVFGIKEDCNGKEALQAEEIVAELRVSQGRSMSGTIGQIGVSERAADCQIFLR